MVNVLYELENNASFAIVGSCFAFLKCYFQIAEIFYRREFLYSLLSSNQPRTKLASPLQSVASPLPFCLTEGLIPSQFLVCVIPQ